MRCWAVDVEVGGSVLTIPPLPAADWWPLLADDDLETFLEMLPTGHDLEDRLIEDPGIGRELAAALLEALEEVAGRPVDQARVIAGVAMQAWSWVGGRMALSGFRWDVMPLAAALDALHVTLQKNLTEEGLKQYEALLNQAAPKKIDKAQALSDFESGAGPRPSPEPLRSTGEPSGDSPPRTRRPPQPPRRRGPSGAPTTPPATPGRSDPPARSDTPPA